MEKEYLTKENYEELQSKLDSLYQKGKESAEVTNKSEEEYKILSDDIDTLYDKINYLEKHNNNYINTNTRKLEKKLFRITFTTALANSLLFGILSLLANNPITTLSLLSGGSLFGSIGCIVVMDLIFQKKVSKKERELREEVEKNSNIKELKEEYSNKLKEKNALWKKYLDNSNNYGNILSEIESAKDQISDFEKDFTNLYLLQEPIKVESKPKTRALVKPNN